MPNCFSLRGQMPGWVCFHLKPTQPWTTAEWLIAESSKGFFRNSHSHRGFSPVISQSTEVWNRFNGFFSAAILLAYQKKPLKRFLELELTLSTGLKPRCE